MKQSSNASLKALNSFSVDARARRLLVLETLQDLLVFYSEFQFDPATDLVLGGGSNILFAGDVDGTVILNRVKGRKITHDSADDVLLEVSGGENWHQLVLWSIEQGLTGIENLSLIPGLAGAAPIQNIGAYGVELSDVVESVQAFDLSSGRSTEFEHKDCQFTYRDSYFKSVEGGRFLLTLIRLRLRRRFQPELGYAGLHEELRLNGIKTPTAKQVSDAVIQIRQRKLPDPQVLGNAGSFFKNPVVEVLVAQQMKKEFNDLPVYPSGENNAKISAAWMIEQCGWKGRALGQAAVSKQHALVLVNKGKATGSEILELANAIQESVYDRFGIKLNPEPRIIQ